MNKTAYNQVAKTINNALKAYDELSPRVTVIDTSNQGKYCDKWSLAINDDLYDLAMFKGLAQDLLYSDEVYTVTLTDGRDFDVYIEPFNRWLFNLAVL